MARPSTQRRPAERGSRERQQKGGRRLGGGSLGKGHVNAKACWRTFCLARTDESCNLSCNHMADVLTAAGEGACTLSAAAGPTAAQSREVAGRVSSCKCSHAACPAPVLKNLGAHTLACTQPRLPQQCAVHSGAGGRSGGWRRLAAAAAGGAVSGVGKRCDRLNTLAVRFGNAATVQFHCPARSRRGGRALERRVLLSHGWAVWQRLADVVAIRECRRARRGPVQIQGAPERQRSFPPGAGAGATAFRACQLTPAQCDRCTAYITFLLLPLVAGQVMPVRSFTPPFRSDCC